VFEKLRETIEAMLDAATPAAGSENVLGQMHEAVVEAKASLIEMREQLESTERQLEEQRRQLEDAERRGQLAQGIDDHETVEVAEQFAAKHRQRVGILARKLEAQKAELALADKEFAQMRDQLKQARSQRGLKSEESQRLESAYRDLEDVGGGSGVNWKDQLLRSQMDAAAREAAADEQLRELKKKMGR
jgi:DNA repair exonuclease SbcCD ATPase subunit